MMVLILCRVCTIAHITILNLMPHVVLHLENFVIVECVGFSFGFSKSFCCACYFGSLK